MNLERALEHCATEVRRHDYDRYLCALFAAPPARQHLFALYALNLELSRIAESVSETGLGEIRLQWWRETLDGITQGRPREHPVAIALAGTGALRNWHRAGLDRMIGARADDLLDVPFADQAALTGYAEGTGSTLLELSLETLGIADDQVRTATKPLGRAWALAGMMRATGFLAARGRCVFPADVMSRHGATMRDLRKGTASDGVRNAVAEIAGWAEADLAAATRTQTPRGALPVMLTATLTRAYLRRLRRVQFNPFDARLELSPLARQWAVLLRAVKNRP